MSDFRLGSSGTAFVSGAFDHRSTESGSLVPSCSITMTFLYALKPFNVPLDLVSCFDFAICSSCALAVFCLCLGWSMNIMSAALNRFVTRLYLSLYFLYRAWADRVRWSAALRILPRRSGASMRNARVDGGPTMFVGMAVEVVSRMELGVCLVNYSSNGVVHVVLPCCRRQSRVERINTSRSGDPIRNNEVVPPSTCCIALCVRWIGGGTR